VRVLGERRRWRERGGRGGGWRLRGERVGGGGQRRSGGEEDGRSVVGDGKRRVALREVGERGGGDAEGTEVVGVRGGQQLPRRHSVLHVAAALLAAPHRVLVLHLGGRAPHPLSPDR
jgi:hypothetical protein